MRRCIRQFSQSHRPKRRFVRPKDSYKPASFRGRKISKEQYPSRTANMLKKSFTEKENTMDTSGFLRLQSEEFGDVFVTKVMVKTILSQYPAGSELQGNDLLIILELIKRHPFYNTWVGNRDVKEVFVDIPIMYRNKDIKCFTVRPTNRDLITDNADLPDIVYFSYKYCLCPNKLAKERIFFSAVKSLMETSKLRHAIRNWSKQQSSDISRKEYRIDYKAVGLLFLKMNNIDIYNTRTLTRMIYRNENGYWGFQDEETKQILFDAIMEAFNDKESPFRIHIHENPNRGKEFINT